MSKKERSDLAIFCENIRLLRLHHGYTKKKMAEICGISTRTLTKIEQGIVPPRLKADIVFYLAQHFRLRPYQLFIPLWPEEEKGPLV